MNQITFDQPILRDLGDGLILRRSSPADAEALADFCAHIHSDDGWDKPDLRIAAWTRDLLTRPHPTFHADDFSVVAEAATGRIVSTLNLIPQTWTYEGIPFGVGRPELVGTLPEFRNRGLVRLQMEEVHRWSAARGDLVQVITGIPYYYRLFGYEMGLDLDGGRGGFAAGIPDLPEGQTEAFLVRPAVTADIPFLMELYNHAAARSELYAVRDEALWQYELDGCSVDSVSHRKWKIIERAETHEPVGYLMLPNWNSRDALFVMRYELKPGVSWLEATPSVLRHIHCLCQTPDPETGKVRTAYTLLLGQDHPVYALMGNDLPQIRKPYAWYVRVPDLPAFIRRIAPALEARLENSIAVGYSGEIKFNFYRNGMRLAFEQGKLQTAEAWQPTPEDWGHIAFPELTFLQVLFGYRSTQELRQSYADCWWHTESHRALVDILFPRKISSVLGIT
ncbi:MAG: GNAT family N-acetyltransferase [Chloroflexi bacterium]|nr:GNAT family N-acetyltransferase [Chloroflexota bacterium]